MKVIIIGSNGQLGTDLMKAFQHGNDVIGLAHHEIEVTDPQSCQLLKEHKPDVVITTAAFHKTDICEDEPLKTFSVNALGARNIATVTKELGATAVFISTDYVFDGFKNEPYSEDDVPNPINTYGISKLAGEFFTKQNPKHYVFRVASLFGVAGASGKGGNFVETMIGKAKKNEAITVVDDMWMSPTYTKDSAIIIKKVIESKLPYGIYHATNSGYCSWFEFAQSIIELSELKANLTATKSSQQKTKAARPRFSALKTVKLSKYNVQIRDWKEALHDYLVEKGHIPDA